MICQNCGQEFVGKFCPNCGTKAPEPAAYAAPDNTQPQPTPDLEQHYQQQAYQQPVDPSGAPVGGGAPNGWQQPSYPSYPQPNQTQQAWNQPTQWQGTPDVQQAQWQGTPDGQPPKKKHTGVIIGCVIGGVVLVLIIVVILIFALFSVLRGTNSVVTGDDPSSSYSTVIPEGNDPADPGAGTETPTQPSNPAGSSDSYAAGTYTVGVNMPAGDYLLLCESADYGGYVEIRYDANWGNFDNMDVFVMNDAFDNRTYIRVEEGQNIQFERCEAIPAASAPAFDGSNGYPEGTYLVGRDMPAGQYTLTQTTEYEGYYVIFTDPGDEMGSVVESDQFEGSMTITVQEGQYLTLSLSEIRP